MFRRPVGEEWTSPVTMVRFTSRKCRISGEIKTESGMASFLTGGVTVSQTEWETRANLGRRRKGVHSIMCSFESILRDLGRPRHGRKASAGIREATSFGSVP